MRKDVPYPDGTFAGGIGKVSMNYLGGFHYQGTVLKFFPTAEGYVQATPLKVGFAYSYVYNYTDHLGNIRLSYAQDPENPNVLKIMEENHYYPFGLKHTNYNSDQLAFRGIGFSTGYDKRGNNTYDNKGYIVTIKMVS